MKFNIVIIEAVVFSLILFGSSLSIANVFEDTNTFQTTQLESIDIVKENENLTIYDIYQRSENDEYIKEINDEYSALSLISDQNDMGYNVDVLDRIGGARNIYIGEPEDTCPGRTRKGTIDPSVGDEGDWYRFSVCKGQSIQATLTSSSTIGFELADTTGAIIDPSYTADVSGWYFIHVFSNGGTSNEEYYINLVLSNQNDAETGSDAGDSFQSATKISSGTYEGYMDYNDVEDWYSFDVSSGDGIRVSIYPMEKSDFDLHLYDPNEVKVHSAKYYGEDTLEYFADTSGTWKIQIDMFPGYDTDKWPDDYFLYGSGVYELEFSISDDIEAPPVPESQPDIHPIAQTFIITDDPDSNKDEYGYLAAVPASNYLENGERYVSPIVYQGVDSLTNWFGTIDDTTQYLLDDWDTYLNRNSLTAEEILIQNEPISAAAEIANQNWVSSDTVVIAIDGSAFEDAITTVVDQQTVLNPTKETKRVSPDELKDIGGLMAKPMFIGKEWGAIAVHSFGEEYSGDTGIITPKYESLMADWWPYPQEGNGPDTDVYFPVIRAGIWLPYTDSVASMEEMIVTTVKGDRYNIPVTTTDCSINVTVTTDEPSYLRIYLIDPEGNIRRPSMPHWNGGPINPIHIWNGGHWHEIGVEPWRFWQAEFSTEHSVEIHYPMEGDWTAIVVPPSLETASGPVDYTIKGVIKEYNKKRVNAGLSAANAAVLASINHAPLLYVTESDTPSETANTISSLGANSIIFVNIGDISTADPGATVTYSTMQEVIDAIKAYESSENFITITSFGTGDGYFAPSGMIAAYHSSPVLTIGDAQVAYDTIDKITTWEEYAGDYYHGCLSLGHLPQMDHPFDWKELIQGILNGEFPHAGFDLKLRWYSQTAESINAMIDNYGLNREGKEIYMFVSPRDTDIRSHISRAVEGNRSYSGQIPVETPAFSTAHICRNILYPALIYANPGRDITSAVMMNHWEDYDWITNDGATHSNDVTRSIKESFSSHDRFFDGHTIWENILDRHNEGASIMYQCSHGTGGSGICCMYKNFAEQFPYAELTHEYLLDFDWWDSWRGYYFDNSLTQSARNNGRFWCNSGEPTLYDIVHFKWCDQLFDNLHSQINLWQSCTTAHHFGPMIYLEHGAVLYYGNSNTGRSPQTDFMDSWWLKDFLIHGKSIGESHADLIWLFGRDYTTLDPTTIYGVSSLDSTSQVSGSNDGLVNTWVFFGDPTLQAYNPTWTEPIPMIP